MGGKREANLAPSQVQTIGAGGESTGSGVVCAAGSRTTGVAAADDRTIAVTITASCRTAAIAPGSRTTGATAAIGGTGAAGRRTAAFAFAVDRACEGYGCTVDFQPLLGADTHRHE